MIRLAIPSDATHYFLWWDGLHIYKKDGKNWYWLINDNWSEAVKCNHVKVSWFFGYYQLAGSYKHKLHRFTFKN